MSNRLKKLTTGRFYNSCHACSTPLPLMQSENHNLESEDWHDFEVSSRREIISILTAVCEKRQSISMLINGGAAGAVTTIFEVNAEDGYVIFDCSIDREQNRRVVAASKITFETNLDKIRILFWSDHVEECNYEGGAAFWMSIPDRLIRLQRREFYRMSTPVSKPVRCSIPLPGDLGGGVALFPLVDISGGGLAILDDKLILDNTIGRKYTTCRFDLPDIGIVMCSLNVRNSHDLKLLNGKTSRRLGCLFVDIPKAMLSIVQRYITKLERDRNARGAGLG